MKQFKIHFLKNFYFVLFLFILTPNYAQDTFDLEIKLKNPSFEGVPRPGKLPRDWHDCGSIQFPHETPPDMHPVKPNAIFGVSKKPMDGNTYLGLVVRKNDSWESLSQKLELPIFSNVCYNLKINLATSENYLSPTRGSRTKVFFTDPIKIQIWGGKELCSKMELLTESPLIKNHDWKEYEFHFSPKENYEYISFVAFYQIPTLDIPNGNILMDKTSPIIAVNCDNKNIKLKSNEYPENVIFYMNEMKKNLAEEKKKKIHPRIKKRKLENEIRTESLVLFFDKNYSNQIEAVKNLSRILNRNPEYKIFIYFDDWRKIKTSIPREDMERIFIEEGVPKERFEIAFEKQKGKKVVWIKSKIHYGIGTKKIE